MLVPFQSTRSSQTSTLQARVQTAGSYISIHEVFADLDPVNLIPYRTFLISIHEVFADLDFGAMTATGGTWQFQSTRSSQTSTQLNSINFSWLLFQSTRSSQTSTQLPAYAPFPARFQSTRSSQTSTASPPRSSRRWRFQSTRSSQTSTRLTRIGVLGHEFQSTRSSQTSTRTGGKDFPQKYGFQSTRSSQTSTPAGISNGSVQRNFNPRGLRRPRPVPC